MFALIIYQKMLDTGEKGGKPVVSSLFHPIQRHQEIRSLAVCFSQFELLLRLLRAKILELLSHCLLCRLQCLKGISKWGYQRVLQ